MCETRVLDSNLLGIPAGRCPVEVQRQCQEVVRTWRLLLRRGHQLVRDGAWRELGIGAVHLVDPAFTRLAGLQLDAWATVDLRDRWGQSVVDVAERRGVVSERLAEALRLARLDLWEVATPTGPGVVLSRVRDGSALPLHYDVGDPAFPGGSLIAARVLRVGRVSLVLCSTVVKRADAVARLRGVVRGQGSRALVNLALAGARTAIDGDRDLDGEPNWIDVGSATTRRVHQAIDHLVAVHRRSGRDLTKWSAGEVAVRVTASTGPAFEVTVDLGARRRIRCRTRRWTQSAVARELALQAGLSNLYEGDPATTQEWRSVADACAAAATRLRKLSLAA